MQILLPDIGPEPRQITQALLSFDGGGIRGAVSLYFQDELEKLLEKRVGEVFTRVAGTSIGSMLALASIYPNEEGKPRWSAGEMIPLFEDSMRKIFSRTWGYYLQNLGGLIGPQYSRKQLDAFSELYFGNTKLNQGLLPATIPALDFCHQSAVIFRSEEEGLYMKDVIGASTAAPTYFSSYTFEYRERMHTFTDGGQFANNPTERGFEDLVRTTGWRNKIVIISFGTGVDTQVSPPTTKNWGLLQWLPELVPSILNSNASNTENSMRLAIPALPGSGEARTFARLQVQLDDQHDSITNATPENFEYLRDKVKSFVLENPDMMRGIAWELGQKS